MRPEFVIYSSMNVKKQVQYWLKSAKNDFETAQLIFNAGKNYHHCLFFCHLVLEKGLKALVTKKTGTIPPKIHDLESLAEKARLQLSNEVKDFFGLMTGYSIEARYPDEKFKIYKRSTKALAANLLQRTTEMFQWIEKLAEQ